MKLVIEVPSQFSGVLRLLDRHTQSVERSKVSAKAHGLDAIARFIIAQNVLEVQTKVETIHLAVAVGHPVLLEVNAVTRAGKVSFDQNCAARGHHYELTASPYVGPIQVAQGLIAHIIAE